MMKNTILKASAALLSFSLLTGGTFSTAHAEEVTGTVEIGKIFKKKIKVSVLLPKVQARDLAPNISSEQVIYIVSTNTYPGGEYIAQGQTTTSLDQGGAQMELVLAEVGYGSNYPQITMAGQTLQHSVIEERVPFCIINGQINTSCPAGTVATGYLYEINLSGYQSGKFTFFNTSQNRPSVTGSTFLNIL